jgi:hypothetical protein
MKLHKYNHTLLIPDGVDSTGAAVDPLNEDLGSVDTSFPLWAAGQIAEFKVVKSEVVEPDSPEKAPRWKVEVEAITPVQALEGGQPLTAPHAFLSCNLACTGKLKQSDMVKFVAALAQGIGATKTPGRTLPTIRDWAPQCSGLVFRAKTHIKPGKDGYDAQNDLRFIK